MARETRSQRRARRDAQAQSAQAAGGGASANRVQRQQQLRQQQAKSQTGTQQRRSQGAAGFVAESWAELKKVDWPGQSQVIQATVVVLIACAVVGAFLYVVDLIWKPVV